MEKFTYQQFAKWCSHWDMTVEEGYRAMCFTANIIGENIDNCLRYNQRVENNPYNSDVVKKMTKTRLEDAQKLMQLYLRLDEEIYDVLEAYADANDTKTDTMIIEESELDEWVFDCYSDVYGYPFRCPKCGELSEGAYDKCDNCGAKLTF